MQETRKRIELDSTTNQRKARFKTSLPTVGGRPKTLPCDPQAFRSQYPTHPTAFQPTHPFNSGKSISFKKALTFSNWKDPISKIPRCQPSRL